MYLNWLTTFKHVVEEGSYTRAAEVLFISQSGASQQIRSLESAFGAPLIQRVGRRLELTRAGKNVYDFACKVEVEYNATRKRVDDLTGRSSPVITVVGSTTPLVHLLPPVMRRFWHEYPDIGVKTLLRTGRQITDAVRDGLADIGIQVALHLDSSVAYKPFQRDMIIGIGSPRHSLAEAISIAPSRFANEKVALLGSGSELRKSIDDWFEAHEAPLGNVLEVSGIEEIRSAAIEDIAVGILPDFVVADDLATGRLVQLDIKGFDLTRTLYVIHRQDLKEPVERIIEILVQQQ